MPDLRSKMSDFRPERFEKLVLGLRDLIRGLIKARGVIMGLEGLIWVYQGLILDLKGLIGVSKGPS